MKYQSGFSISFASFKLLGKACKKEAKKPLAKINVRSKKPSFKLGKTCVPTEKNLSELEKSYVRYRRR